MQISEKRYLSKRNAKQEPNYVLQTIFCSTWDKGNGREAKESCKSKFDGVEIKHFNEDIEIIQKDTFE